MRVTTRRVCIHTNKIAGNMPYPRDAASNSCV